MADIYGLTRSDRDEVRRMRTVIDNIRGPDVINRPNGIWIGRAPTSAPRTPPSSGSAIFQITNRSRDGDNFRWVYGAERLKWAGGYSFTQPGATVFLYNVAELENTVNAPVLVGARVLAHAPQRDDDGNEAWFFEQFKELVQVDVIQDGGSDGTATTKPSYTYTLVYAGVTLGTGISPMMARSNGKIVPAVVGLAEMGDETAKLVWCDETPETVHC